MASTPKEATVEMTETMVYLMSCLASGVCRLCQTCSARDRETGHRGNPSRHR